ncbi:acyl carrier protein [Oscillibacter sp. MSJ-2]|uniref:Acyl carrier protein n=1 Tax=Dysosmobacter acutus TaxID=2841504 RepID=A0ABS6FCU1_9FIRM|nr:acyl-ACP thioesterase domain-containing protein [Dysosmobacter acutus]MBU5627868.1 acyl carrier protein [Dysosmobacter acutus]
MEYLTQELTETTFSREEELTFANCDVRKKMKLSAMLSTMASIAGYDYDARGLTYEVLRDMQQVFLLARITLKVHRLPENRDILKVTTWENGVRGVHMRRCFDLSDREGRPCVAGRSSWILVDPDSRKILRPGLFTGKPIAEVERELDCPECKKVLLPKEGVEEIGRRQVRFTDLDANGHLYSGNYGNVIWDFLPEELQLRDLREFSINYNHEATLGEELRLTGCRAGDRYYMMGQGGGEPCFTCECVF